MAFVKANIDELRAAMNTLRGPDTNLGSSLDADFTTQGTGAVPMSEELMLIQSEFDKEYQRLSKLPLHDEDQIDLVLCMQKRWEALGYDEHYAKELRAMGVYIPVD